MEIISLNNKRTQRAHTSAKSQHQKIAYGCNDKRSAKNSWIQMVIQIITNIYFPSCVLCVMIYILNFIKIRP